MGSAPLIKVLHRSNRSRAIEVSIVNEEKAQIYLAGYEGKSTKRKKTVGAEKRSTPFLKFDVRKAFNFF